MIKLYDKGIIYDSGKIIEDISSYDAADCKKNTIAYGILQSHTTSGDMNKLNIKFDALASHDITYVGIIQTARASGLKEFPVPYVLTNCHNSLCAVGGTINEDDHIFGISAAKKYGGVYVPAHFAVIHQYMREMVAGCGKMILGSDSHTRYGALGTMAIGEGGGELAKQILKKTYDIDYPEVIGVYLTGAPARHVGPQDISLALIKAVFDNAFVKNKVLEFIGDGIKNLNVEYRNGIDVMTTETTCLSSVWQTDSAVSEYLEMHGRGHEYKELKPTNAAYYDGFIHIDLSKIVPMIAMPFHPSNVYSIDELNKNLKDIIHIIEETANAQLENSTVKFELMSKIKNNALYIDQGVIAGCAGGTFDNICDAADIIGGGNIGTGAYNLSVYPSSQPTFAALTENGVVSRLMMSGAVIRSAFCGPCFGAGDVPANGALSIRHTTRNFPNREGSKPSAGQMASVALMDARSIAATSINGGKLTSAAEVDVNYTKPNYYFKKEIYTNRVFDGYKNAETEEPLILGPGIKDWPQMPEIAENLLVMAAAVIYDPVTTTDELIPSGETSSYRSNPLGLAEFTLSRKDPAYVSRAKSIHKVEQARLDGGDFLSINDDVKKILEELELDTDINSIGIGSFIYAKKPGDGSAREQAASCQKVLGGYVNIAREYATKRYRSNLINWGIIPFIYEQEADFCINDYLYLPEVRKALQNADKELKAVLIRNGEKKEITLTMPTLTDEERKILLSGCLINYYGK